MWYGSKPQRRLRPGKVYGMQRCRPRRRGIIFEIGAGKWLIAEEKLKCIEGESRLIEYEARWTSNRDDATKISKALVDWYVKKFNLGWLTTLEFQRLLGDV